MQRQLIVNGDARLWFRIAQANALDVAPTAKLMAGQVLQVPAALAAGADAQGFRPYDPSAVIGDQSAALPAPAADNGGCGALGKVIMGSSQKTETKHAKPKPPKNPP